MRNLFFINAYRLGRYNESIASFYKVLAKRSYEHPCIGCQRVQSALDNLGKRNESIPFLNKVIVFAAKALAIDSKNVDALAAKGRSLAALGNYTQAIPDLDKAFAEIQRC